MDGIEKRVFRRKHALLSTLLEPSPSYLLALQKQGILNEDMASHILGAPERDKITVLLAMLESGHSTTLTKIIYMLEQTGYDWVADEIYADLLWEKGKVQLEGYIMQEATYFANTLMSDRGYIDLSRKYDLSVVIASRHQVAKEAWKRQMTRKSRKVKEELQSLQQDVMKIFKDVDKVLIEKEKWRIKEKEDVKREVRGKGGNGEYTMSVRLLQDGLEKLQLMLENVIGEYDKLLDERKKCYGIIGADPDEGSLEEVLDTMLKKVSKEIGKSSSDANMRKSQVHSLDKEVKALKSDIASQLSHQNYQIQTLQKTVYSTDRQLRDAKENLSDMTRKRDIYRAQADYWRERTEVLEKTRRLGYYHFSRMHRPIPMKEHVPGAKTRSKGVICFDKDLLEAEGNIVYIKGESNIKPPVSDDPKEVHKPTAGLPSKGRRAIDIPGYEPSFQDANASQRKTHSLYHSKCIPTEEDEVKTKSKPLRAVKSTPNLYQGDKVVTVKAKAPNRKSEASNQNARNVRSDGQVSSGDKTKENVYTGKPTPSVLTNGLNVSPYNKTNLSVLHATHPVTSYLSSNNMNGNSVMSYYTTEHPNAMVAGGLYRPILMSQTAPHTSTQAVNEAIMHNTFFTYSESADEGYSQTSFSSRSEKTSKSGSKTPKEKFDESVKELKVTGRKENGHERTEKTPDGKPVNGHVGTERISGNEKDTGNQVAGPSGIGREGIVEGKEDDPGGPHPMTNGHCRCCPQCCKEAATDHPYQGYIN